MVFEPQCSKPVAALVLCFGLSMALGAPVEFVMKAVSKFSWPIFLFDGFKAIAVVFLGIQTVGLGVAAFRRNGPRVIMNPKAVAEHSVKPEPSEPS